jgi:hypothetical protein
LRQGAVDRQVVVEVPLQRLGVQRGAVVERHAVTQRQRPGREVAVGLDRLGQVRLDVAVRVAGDQRVEHGVGHVVAGLAALELAGQVRVGLALEPDRDAAAGDGLPLILLGAVDDVVAEGRVPRPARRVPVAAAARSRRGRDHQQRGDDNDRPVPILSPHLLPLRESTP